MSKDNANKPKRKSRRKYSVLAQSLYEAYQRVADQALWPPWDECKDEERQRWEEVADTARDWAHETVQWEE